MWLSERVSVNFNEGTIYNSYLHNLVWSVDFQTGIRSLEWMSVSFEFHGFWSTK